MKKIIIITIVSFYLLGCYSDENNENKKNYVIKEYIVFDDESNGVPVGVTGMTIDTKRDLLVFCRYNSNIDSKIIIKTKKNEFVKEIDVTKYLDHLEAIAYNEDNDSFYVWSWEKGYDMDNDPGNKIIEISQCGKLLNTYFIPLPNMDPGMMFYNKETKLLLLKDNNSSIVRFLNLKNMEYEKEINLNIGGEGIGYDCKTDNFFTHDGINVYKHDESGKIINSIPSPVYKQKNCEGLVVDNDGSIWITADEYLHGRIKNGNKCWNIVF